MVDTTASQDTIVALFKQLQEELSEGLEAVDGKAKFEEDRWERPGGGGGRSRVIRKGNVFEKGGVNFSHVHGAMPSKISQRLGITGQVDFHATGVSLVIHPESPLVPIIHMNVRYFETSDGTHWFGGGIDLTPIYVVEEDAIFFHQQLKDVCDRFGPNYYNEFKPWCDEYFTLIHRNDTRGIGGIFFDHMKAISEDQKSHNFDFVRSVGEAFVPTYTEIANRHKDKSYTQAHKDFQLMRRSRYVEFNLVWDKGTKFGLDTNGRTESILMSMPPMAAWSYNYQPDPGSPEAATMKMLRPHDWLRLEQ